MAVPVLLPRLGMSMKTALFAEWYEPDGATVRQGEPVCRIESDYVAMEIEAESDGILRHRAKPGHDFPAGEVVGLILGAGERMPSSTETAGVEVSAPGPRATAAVAPPPSERAHPAPPEPVSTAHDYEIYEPVLLFPRRMTEGVSPPPTEDTPATSEQAPQVETAEDESAWERIPGDDQDFESAWRNRSGRVSLPADFKNAPRRVLPLGRVQPEAAGPAEATDEPAAPPPPPPMAAPRPAAVSAPVRLPVALDQPREQEQERETLWDDEGPRAAPEPASQAPPESVQSPAAAEQEPEAVAAPVHSPAAAEQQPGAMAAPVLAPAPAEQEPEAVSAPVVERRRAPIGPRPEPEPVASAETPPERRASAAPPSTILNLRATVRVDEALKMREQLTREWSGSGVKPTNEDVVLRAVARAVVEAGISRRHDDHVGLRVLKGQDRSAPIYVFAGGASRPFREAVGDLAALVEEGGPGVDHAQCTVTSLEAFGIDDSLPELGRDQPLAISMGAVRRLPVVDGERLGQTQVLTLTLAYDARVVGEAAAARLLARVRDLVEAPYALLVA